MEYCSPLTWLAVAEKSALGGGSVEVPRSWRGGRGGGGGGGGGGSPVSNPNMQLPAYRHEPLVFLSAT